ncbi:MAG: phosphatase PAP2 family protein [Proteiniphilum sp.]|nr:phosphatase PAP2 family protein [Proteiniphilum sp.]MDD3969057.1 phosphatase PAP2 family protein [Proteiniphilum sp.]MDD4800122.1 phosphatase PAP2 family protein [Proteiniphilum sp.]
MFEKIISIDRNLFFAINGTHSYFTDCFMWLYSGRMIWIPITLFMIGFIIYKKNWKEWLPVLVALVILFLLCDKITSDIIKPYFARLRPTHNPDIMEQVRTLYGYTAGRYGFVSSHAANASGLAVFSSLLFKNKRYTLVIVIWAVIMGYSRIYLGIHYMSDVLGGMIIGSFIGYLTYFLYSFSINKLSVKTNYVKLAIYSPVSVKILTFTMIVYIFLFIFLSPLLIDFLK